MLKYFHKNLVLVWAHAIKTSIQISAVSASYTFGLFQC